MNKLKESLRVLCKCCFFFVTFIGLVYFNIKILTSNSDSWDGLAFVYLFTVAWIVSGIGWAFFAKDKYNKEVESTYINRNLWWIVIVLIALYYFVMFSIG